MIARYSVGKMDRKLFSLRYHNVLPIGYKVKALIIPERDI